MKIVGYRKSSSGERRIGGCIFARIDEEGVRGWGTNRGKMTASSGGHRAGMGAIAGEGAMCGTCMSGGK